MAEDGRRAAEVLRSANSSSNAVSTRASTASSVTRSAVPWISTPRSCSQRSPSSSSTATRGSRSMLPTFFDRGGVWKYSAPSKATYQTGSGTGQPSARSVVSTAFP